MTIRKLFFVVVGTSELKVAKKVISWLYDYYYDLLLFNLSWPFWRRSCLIWKMIALLERCWVSLKCVQIDVKMVYKAFPLIFFSFESITHNYTAVRHRKFGADALTLMEFNNLAEHYRNIFVQKTLLAKFNDRSLMPRRDVQISAYVQLKRHRYIKKQYRM